MLTRFPLSYTYDKNGNVLTVTDKNGTISRTYDALNRVTAVTDPVILISIFIDDLPGGSFIPDL